MHVNSAATVHGACAYMATNLQPSRMRVSVAIIVPLVWLVFLALWLIFYAGSFSILQNLGIFVLSIAIVGILEVLSGSRGP